MQSDPRFQARHSSRAQAFQTFFLLFDYFDISKQYDLLSNGWEDVMEQAAGSV